MATKKLQEPLHHNHKPPNLCRGLWQPHYLCVFSFLAKAAISRARCSFGGGGALAACRSKASTFTQPSIKFKKKPSRAAWRLLPVATPLHSGPSGERATGSFCLRTGRLTRTIASNRLSCHMKQIVRWMFRELELSRSWKEPLRARIKGWTFAKQNKGFGTVVLRQRSLRREMGTTGMTSGPQSHARINDTSSGSSKSVTDASVCASALRNQSISFPSLLPCLASCWSIPKR